MFVGNESTCLRVMPRHIEKIVDRISELKEKASEYLVLLVTIVKVGKLDLPLKRNQGIVMKTVFAHYNEVAYIMKKPRQIR